MFQTGTLILSVLAALFSVAGLVIWQNLAGSMIVLVPLLSLYAHFDRAAWGLSSLYWYGRGKDSPAFPFHDAEI